jgi:uncharacterized peroxidase-related enzyme
MPYVKTIPCEDSQGELKEAYNTMTKSCGRITHVQAVSSLKPGIIKTLMAHVSSVMFGESNVSRAEGEMVAAEVSATNKCQYLTLAHAQDLPSEDPESQLAEQRGENYHDAELPPKQGAMLEFAEFLTTTSSAVTEDWVEELRSVGWQDSPDAGVSSHLIRNTVKKAKGAAS